eukprot:Blabericola_migrator_1__1931@NODE_1525_length_4341_cov_101_237950_g584_i2_p4_GENE_NODE_1525_length_4341_cov_101_237950_g584_i2NODE_1525_length_4341_cov_101_237950_g584_i2_p4_ORF_typecomplete_len101_score8_95_NODE_1525_length_4341_cov_101_237950_g584_i240344336
MIWNASQPIRVPAVFLSKLMVIPLQRDDDQRGSVVTTPKINLSIYRGFVFGDGGRALRLISSRPKDPMVRRRSNTRCYEVQREELSHSISDVKGWQHKRT